METSIENKPHTKNDWLVLYFYYIKTKMSTKQNYGGKKYGKTHFQLFLTIILLVLVLVIVYGGYQIIEGI